MASGNSLFNLTMGASSPTATLSAPLFFILGTSTPVEWFPVAQFDPSTNWYRDFHGLVMPAHYAGGGLTCVLRWHTTVTTNNMIWGMALREIADDAEDIDTTAHTYDYNAVTSAPASVAGEVKYSTITFTSGADMDNVGAGDLFTVRIRRDAANGSDTCTGVGNLLGFDIKET